MDFDIGASTWPDSRRQIYLRGIDWIGTPGSRRRCPCKRERGKSNNDQQSCSLAGLEAPRVCYNDYPKPNHPINSSAYRYSILRTVLVCLDLVWFRASWVKVYHRELGWDAGVAIQVDIFLARWRTHCRSNNISVGRHPIIELLRDSARGSLVALSWRTLWQFNVDTDICSDWTCIWWIDTRSWLFYWVRRANSWSLFWRWSWWTIRYRTEQWDNACAYVIHDKPRPIQHETTRASCQPVS
jgi:hypothetical protein